MLQLCESLPNSRDQMSRAGVGLPQPPSLPQSLWHGLGGATSVAVGAWVSLLSLGKGSSGVLSSPSLFSQAFLETSHVFWRLLFFLLYRNRIRWPKTAPDSFSSTSGLSLLFPSSLASCTSQHNSSETFDILGSFQTQFPIT